MIKKFHCENCHSDWERDLCPTNEEYLAEWDIFAELVSCPLCYMEEKEEEEEEEK